VVQKKKSTPEGVGLPVSWGTLEVDLKRWAGSQETRKEKVRQPPPSQKKEDILSRNKKANWVLSIYYIQCEALC
jgi:hypothetical protein